MSYLYVVKIKFQRQATVLLPAFFRDLELNTRSLFKESFYLRPTLTSSQSN